MIESYKKKNHDCSCPEETWCIEALVLVVTMPVSKMMRTLIWLDECIIIIINWFYPNLSDSPSSLSTPFSLLFLSFLFLPVLILSLFNSFLSLNYFFLSFHSYSFHPLNSLSLPSSFTCYFFISLTFLSLLIFSYLIFSLLLLSLS